jgi:predicted PurR-regulated permease PerM
LLRKITARTRNLLLALVGLLLLLFAWKVRSVLNPLITAYFLAFVLHPLVLRLQNYGWSRLRAVNTIFLTAILVFGSVTVGIGVQAAHYSQTVASEEWRQTQFGRIDDFLERNRSRVIWIRDAVGYPMLEEDDLNVSNLYADLRREYAKASENELGEDSSTQVPLVPLALSIFGGVIAFLSFIVLLPIYTYFLLFELERIHTFVQRYIPKTERDRVSMVGGQIGEVIGNFFRGRLAICMAKGLFISAGLGLCGVQYALLLGMSAGVLALVPFAGPFLAFVAAGLLALQQPKGDYTQEFDLLGALWRTGVVYGLAELLEGYYLTPKILGESLGLHPVVVLVSIFAGGAAFGMFGILLALPVTAALVILFRVFVLPPLAQFADGAA